MILTDLADGESVFLDANTFVVENPYAYWKLRLPKTRRQRRA